MTCSASSFVGTRISPLVALRSSLAPYQIQPRSSVPTKSDVRAEAHPQLVSRSVSSELVVCNKLPSFQTPYEPWQEYLCFPTRVGWIWPESKWDGRTPCRPKLVESLRPASVKKSRSWSRTPPETRRPFFEDDSVLQRQEGVEANETGEWG